MFFTVSVDMADGGTFEFSTESILKFLQTVHALGHPGLQAVEDDEDFEDEDGEDIPEEIAQHFEDGVEYSYDEDTGFYMWYDEEHESWYRLDIETGEWLLVEDEVN